jgi:hypothetical protein
MSRVFDRVVLRSRAHGCVWIELEHSLARRGRTAGYSASPGAHPGCAARNLRAGSGYLSHSESVAHFGVADARSLQLQVRWLGSNRVQSFSKVPASRILVLVEPE